MGYPKPKPDESKRMSPYASELAIHLIHAMKKYGFDEIKLSDLQVVKDNWDHPTQLTEDHDSLRYVLDAVIKSQNEMP